MNIECTSIKGKKVIVPKEKLVFRPAAYALIINNGDILIQSIRSNGKLFFPGGGVEIGEKIEDALKREVLEETGIRIEVEKFLTFREGFFYYDPLDEAYHNLSYYFICKPLSFDLLEEENVDDDEAGKPYWIKIEELRKVKDNLGVVVEVLKLI